MDADNQRIIKDSVIELGYRAAYITHAFGNSKMIIIAVENADFTPMPIDEIEKLHKALLTKLFVENVIDENTSVEVGSPGLDRLLVEIEDFKRFLLSKVKVSLKQETNKLKKFKAIITQVVDNKIAFELLDQKDKTIIEISLDDINHASLIPEINFTKKDKR